MKILGISRSPRFSPNSVDRDSAIFDAVSSRLNRRGNDVSVISEDLFVAVNLEEFDRVYSMARGKDVIAMLAEEENKNNSIIINSAIALQRNTRVYLTNLFTSNNIPQPRYKVLRLPLKNEIRNEPIFPLWLKRADACTQSQNDVCFVSSINDFYDALHSFMERGIYEVVAEEHIEGDLVKFYGVEGEDFFNFIYPTENLTYSKFGLEKHNGSPSHYSFSEKSLKSIADKAARLCGFLIYGGDAIIKSDRTFYLIDFNDWPSFSSCRKSAAKAITNRIINMDKGKQI